MNRLNALLLTVCLTACGADPTGEKPGIQPKGPQIAPQGFDALNHTPGFFRDTYRVLEAQADLDAAVAAPALRQELAVRVQDMGDIPDLLNVDTATIRALVQLAYRSMQATSGTPETSRDVGAQLLALALSMDPALEVWNTANPSTPITRSSGGADTFGAAAQNVLKSAASGAPTLCSSQSFATNASTWDTGEAVTTYVPEYCEPDEFVGGYCESDEWIEGQCYEEWVPEECSGGYWRDDGYYEYICYGSDDCRYEWRQRWRYIDGDCNGGYYDEYCESGYWEYGLCYDGTLVPGICYPGRYEYRFPDGRWTYAQAATVPAECQGVRPAQFASAVSAAQALRAYLYEDLDAEWKKALDELLATADLDQPNEPALGAIIQVLEGAVVGSQFTEAPAP